MKRCRASHCRSASSYIPSANSYSSSGGSEWSAAYWLIGAARSSSSCLRVLEAQCSHPFRVSTAARGFRSKEVDVSSWTVAPQTCPVSFILLSSAAMIEFWSHHPYIVVITVVLVFAGLAIALLRKWITTGEFLSLLLEIIIVVMIAVELSEGAEQEKILTSLNASANATAGSLQGLRTAQEKSAGTLAQMNDSIGRQAKTTQSMNRVLERQLAILSGEQKARLDDAKLHPDLRVAVAQNGTPSVVMLHANATTGDQVYPIGKGQIGANPAGRIGLAFYLLNVGNTPLKRPRIAARVGLPNTFVCLEGPTSSVWLMTGEVPNSARRYCNPGESVIDTMVDIQPTPDAKPETGGTLVRLVYDEAPGATYFQAELIVSGDNFPTTTYGVQVQYIGLFPNAR